jgi:hypothetical protein
MLTQRHSSGRCHFFIFFSVHHGPNILVVPLWAVGKSSSAPCNFISIVTATWASLPVCDQLYSTSCLKISSSARCRWLTPVILATQEAEIRTIAVQSQPWQIVHEPLSWKNLSQKGLVGWAQGKDPEFKLQYHKKKKNPAQFQSLVW